MVGHVFFTLRKDVTSRGNLMQLEITKRNVFASLINYLRNKETWQHVWV